MADLDHVVATIMHQHTAITNGQPLLVAISGIDASGKGYLAEKIAVKLEQQKVRVANINLDGWLNLPHQRFSPHNPAEHFYHHAFRFEALFTQLILPLRQQRTICLEADFAEETAIIYRQHTYEFREIDVILLEGIFLLKRQFQSDYDLSIWIECSFETALERAIARSQEGLSTEATIQAYQTIYFPAQTIHFDRDHPKTAANISLINDPRLR